MVIKNLLPEERPREKCFQQGPEALSNSELLAIIIRCGISGHSAIDIARTCLSHFGSLRQCLQASYHELCQIMGVGKTTYVHLQASLELAKRCWQEKLATGPAINDTTTTQAYLKAHLAAAKQEIFACLFLNCQNHVIAFEKLFYGSLDITAIYPREIIKRSLHHNAAAVIFAHNHPAGTAEPSQHDIELTQTLLSALKNIDVCVYDHLIVTANGCTSLAELGLL